MGSRGRGRGRGGGGRIGPILRDEEGTMVIPLKLDGPPPLFPKLESLPERPDVTSKDHVYLMEKRRQLHSFWNDSAYYIELKKQSSSAHSGDFKRYCDSGQSENKRKALSDYLQLNSSVFPSELLGNERKRRASKPGGLWNNQSQSKRGLGRLEMLARMEQKQGEKEEGDEEKKEEEGDEEDQDVAFDDDEEMDNDYTVFDQIDDDEEYDVDDGGDDDAEGGTY